MSAGDRVRRLTPNEELKNVLNRLNTKHPGLWDRGVRGFPDYRLQFEGNETIKVELHTNHDRVEGQIRGLYSQFCEFRIGMGKLAKETLHMPGSRGLSLSTCPGDDGAGRRHAWLHLSGIPVVFGRWHTHYHRLEFTVPLGKLETIVDALANAPTANEVVFRSS